MTRKARIFYLVLSYSWRRKRDGSVSWIIGLSQLVAKAVVFCLLRVFFFFFFLLGKTGQTDTKSKEEDRVRNTEYMIDRLTDTASNMNAFHYASSSFRLATSSMNLMIDVRNQM